MAGSSEGGPSRSASVLAIGSSATSCGYSPVASHPSEAHHSSNMSLMTHGRHVPLLVVVQVAFIVIFGFFVEYGPTSDSAVAFNVSSTNESNNLGHYYPSQSRSLLSFFCMVAIGIPLSKRVSSFNPVVRSCYITSDRDIWLGQVLHSLGGKLLVTEGWSLVPSIYTLLCYYAHRDTHRASDKKTDRRHPAR